MHHVAEGTPDRMDMEGTGAKIDSTSVVSAKMSGFDESAHSR